MRAICDLDINLGPNWQVRTFVEIFLNIMSNFIPTEFNGIVPRDPPWIIKPLKPMINMENRLFKNLKDMVINQRTTPVLITFVKSAKRLLRMANYTILTLATNITGKYETR